MVWQNMTIARFPSTIVLRASSVMAVNQFSFVLSNLCGFKRKVLLNAVGIVKISHLDVFIKNVLSVWDPKVPDTPEILGYDLIYSALEMKIALRLCSVNLHPYSLSWRNWCNAPSYRVLSSSVPVSGSMMITCGLRSRLVSDRSQSMT